MKGEKYLHGRQEGVKTDQGKKTKMGVIRVIGSEPSSDGGGSSELNSAVHSIYQKAVRNGGGNGEIGDKAVKTR